MPNKLACGSGKFSRRVMALLTAVVIALQSGCVRHNSKPDVPREAGVPVTQFQSALGKVAIVASESMLGSAPVSPVDGKNKGLHISPTKETFSICGELLGAAGCGGDAYACAAVILGGAAICGLVAVPVAIATGKNNKPETLETLNLKATMETTAGPNIIQESLRNQVEADAKAGGVRLVKVPLASAQQAAHDNDYPPLAAMGADTVLEVSMTQIFGEAEGEKNNPVLPLDMQAHIRLIKTSDNNEIFSGDYFYHGKRLRYSEWSANNAERLASAMQKGYESLGRDIGDRIFLLYPFAERLAKDNSGSCGLAMFGPKDDRADDLSPQLSWQSFPRESDFSAIPADIKQVKNVRYELMLATGETGESPDVIYRRDGLKGTMHKIEMELEPNTRYFWSVRAHFTFNGRQRVTEWATYCPFGPQLIVSGNLYRFYTPKAYDLPPKRRLPKVT